MFQEPDWKKKKRRNIELGWGFGRFLAAKIDCWLYAFSGSNPLLPKPLPEPFFKCLSHLVGDWVSNLQKESARSWQTLKFPASRIGIRFFVLALNEYFAESAGAN